MGSCGVTILPILRLKTRVTKHQPGTLRFSATDGEMPKLQRNPRPRFLLHQSQPLFPFPRGEKISLAILRSLIVSGAPNGVRSSMVESQIVILVVAGSSPVGHPISRFSEPPLLENPLKGGRLN